MINGRPVTGLGQVEYRLARDSLVRDYRRGRISRLEVCDAQPELMRVAEHLGVATERQCPICEDAMLVHVTFGFGPGLPPNGRAVSGANEFRALTRSKSEIAFYVVEVCMACSWNHLLRMFTSTTTRRLLRR